MVLLLLIEVVVVLIMGLSLIFALLRGINFECLWNYDSMLVPIESGGVVLIWNATTVDISIPRG